MKRGEKHTNERKKMEGRMDCFGLNTINRELGLGGASSSPSLLLQ
jgi:hypothetical protein